MPNKISFTQGNTPLFEFPITVNGAVQDLTGYTAFFTLTSDAVPVSPGTDSDAQIKMSQTLTSAAIASFQTTNTQTAALKPGTQYYWDLKLKDPTANYYTTIVSGTATIKQSYTQRIS